MLPGPFPYHILASYPRWPHKTFVSISQFSGENKKKRKKSVCSLKALRFLSNLIGYKKVSRTLRTHVAQSTEVLWTVQFNLKYTNVHWNIEVFVQQWQYAHICMTTTWFQQTHIYCKNDRIKYSLILTNLKLFSPFSNSMHTHSVCMQRFCSTWARVRLWETGIEKEMGFRLESLLEQLSCSSNLPFNGNPRR